MCKIEESLYSLPGSKLRRSKLRYFIILKAREYYNFKRGLGLGLVLALAFLAFDCSYGKTPHRCSR